MNFSVAEFLKSNLIKGYKDGSFSKVKVNILAFNYKKQGDISPNDFDEIMKATEPTKDNGVVEGKQ